MAQHTIDLPCIADTYIDSGNPNTNYGSATLLNAGGEEGSSSSHRYYALFKFDWTSLPTGKKVVNVKVRLYSAKAMPSVEGCWIGGGVNPRDFNENTVTYNNYGSAPTNHHIYYSGASLAANTYYEFDFTRDYSLQLINYGVNFIWTKNRWSDNPNFWQIQSREGANPPVLRVTYEDVSPDAPTPKSPIGAYKDSKSIVRFEWQYNSDVGGTQKAFDLQWSTDQVNWTTVSQTTANNYYDMPANTLPAGNIYWRVRTYNEYDEVGPYCDIQSFYAIGAPAAPVINAIPTNTARPLVTWSAFNQQVYQLQVLSGNTVVYDSGVVPGISTRQHKIKLWLEDGEYTVKLRIKNEYDLWSEWSSATVTISTVKPAKPTVTAEKTTTGIKLTISGASGRTLIYRDGVCIGETSTGEYFDNAVANGKEYSYIARAVEGYPERQITNLLGEDGDFEDVSKWFDYYTTHELDDSNKIYGDSGMKIIISGVDGGALYTSGRAVDPLKHYIVSMYLKNVNSTAVFFYVDDGSGGHIKSSEVAGTTFARIMIKLSPSEHTNIIRLLIQLLGSTGQYAYVDAAILTEITEEDYNNLTTEQLLAKYPFGNNTFVAPASETFTDSDPMTATAEFSHALIAPVSDLSDVFTFSRSLNTPPKRTYNLQPGGAFVEYAGRKHPVWEPTEHVSAAWAMAFFLKSWNDVEAFIALVDRKETVLYRDARGRKVYGILSNLTINDERSGYTVGFTLTEVDYIEGVDV